MKPKLAIKDKLFSHAYSTSNWYKPTLFEWDFINLHNNFIFFTDLNVFDVGSSDYSGYKKYAWLVESQAVTPNSYKFIEDNHFLFDKIFTHSEKILSSVPNSYILPIGGCHLDEDEIRLNNEKTKLVSMMFSNKNFAPGHNLRHTIANKLKNFIDVMGSGVNGLHVKKVESCRDYKFSVVVENFKDGYYFTEKIIDCFLTGTIPIYYGTNKISEFFNRDGILTFDTLEDLEKLIENVNFLNSFYRERNKEIVQNFEKALEFKIGDDFLYSKYKNIF